LRTPIEFIILGHREDYLDLTHTMLSLGICRGSTSIAPDGVTRVGFENHLLHSIFNQIDVYFNQILVSPPNNAYAYRVYIEALLNYVSPTKTSHLTSCLWDADIPGYVDNTLDSLNSNMARDVRNAFKKIVLDLIGHLYCDVFNQDKFLINGVEVRIRLVRTKNSFCLMKSKTISKICILDASLLVRRAKISPGVLLAHARILRKLPPSMPLRESKLKHSRYTPA